MAELGAGYVESEKMNGLIFYGILCRFLLDLLLPPSALIMRWIYVQHKSAKESTVEWIDWWLCVSVTAQCMTLCFDGNWVPSTTTATTTTVAEDVLLLVMAVSVALPKIERCLFVSFRIHSFKIFPAKADRSVCRSVCVWAGVQETLELSLSSAKFCPRYGGGRIRNLKNVRYYEIVAGRVVSSVCSVALPKERAGQTCYNVRHDKIRMTGRKS